MRSLTLTWMRKIALGLPLASVTLFSQGGCVYCGDCGGEEELTYTITAEQRAMIGADAAMSDGGVSTCEQLCAMLAGAYDGNVIACSIDDSTADPTLNCTVNYVCIGGRRPAGLLAGACRARGAVGRYFASSARLEAASIPAFEDLARELALHGAPHALIDGARRASRDEARHARAMARLSARFGARPAPVVRAPSAPRTLRAIAEDNAVEGCTREAYAALSAARQAIAATDPAVARVYSGIARDEARHALWSFALHDWASAKLPAARLDELRRESIDALAAELASEAPIALRTIAGVPDAERAVELASALA